MNEVVEKFMNRRNALTLYLFGTIGQISIVSVIVYLLRRNGIRVDYTTIIGMIAIGIGGISSAMWGAIVTTRYKKITLKRTLIDFVKIKQPVSNYLLALIFLSIDFCYILVGGMLQVKCWYIPAILFVKSIIFGGIEEIGWRYTFQPIFEEQHNYVISTLVTFVAWGIWHFLYFYIEGSIQMVQGISFLLGLLTNCFILSALYKKTRSLWICVMTHSLINVFSQISVGGNLYVSIACKVIIICIAIYISGEISKDNEKKR